MRRAFDPLAGVIAAHLTLVFPFASELPAEVLEAHLRAATEGVRRFPVALREVTGQEGEYLFLNVQTGKEEIVALHDRLYTGPLAAHLSRSHAFMPHMTVGRLANMAAFAAALAQARELLHARTFVAEARTLALYHIGDSARAIERVVEL